MELLPLTYFGSIEYYGAIVNNDCAFSIDELFPKQTLRNRTVIVTSQGAKNLSVPVIRPFGAKTKMSEVKISYAEDWQKTHWKSIESAYRSSPFFEFFEQDLKEFYSTNFDFLIEMNLASQQLVCNWMEWVVPELIEENGNGKISYQLGLKKRSSNTSLEKYWQVFKGSVEFVENASILDLIFCEGKNAITFMTRT